MDHAYHHSYPRIHLQKTQALRRIAFFDFDGTVTTKDTMLELFRYRYGTSGFWWGFAVNSPFLLALKAKIMSRKKAKERILKWFFGGQSLNEFQETCDRFGQEIIPGLIRPKAMEEFRRLRDQGFEIVIVSASAENWLRLWCASQGVVCLATRLQVPDNKVSGEIEGENCHGKEKVLRIRQHFQLESYDEIYAYGDTSGDLPMLDIAHRRFYKPFR